MLEAIDGGGYAVPPPPPKPPPPPPLLAKPPIVTTGPSDNVGTPGDSPGFALGALGWAKTQWPTLAATAHGLASAPGVASESLLKAAEQNRGLAERVAKLQNWATLSPADRQTSIDALKTFAAGKSDAVSKLADELSYANKLPRALDAVGAPLDRAMTAFGHSVSSTITAALQEAPSSLQAPLRGLADRLGSTIGKTYENLKTSVVTKVNTLSPELANKESTLVTSLEAASKADTAAASGFLRTSSRVIGTTFGDVAHTKLGTKVVEELPQVDKLSFLRDVPVANIAFAGYGIYADRADGIPDATVANVGSIAVSTVAADGVTSALVAAVPAASMSATAVGGELAVDAVVASGPVGWAVAGGVVAGAAIGYGAYKMIESKAGQDIINGVWDLNGHQIAKGFGEAGTDIAHAGESVWHGTENVGSDIGHGAEDVGKGIAHGASSVAHFFGL